MGSPVFFAAGGTGGAIIVPDDYFFSDTSARNSYFASNPTKLVEGVQVVIGSGASLQLQEYRSSAWVDISAVVRGPTGATGATGEKGDDGAFPIIHTLTEKTSPVANDVLIIEDSASSYAQKKVLYSTILGLIPDQLSDLSDDATHRLVTDTLISTWNAKQAALGYTAENTANKGAASGYAPLGSDSKIPITYLPAISITSVIVSETEPSSPTEGMVWIKISTGVSKIYDADTTTWYEISNSSGYVTTVNGSAGPTVSLDAGDIPADTTNFNNNLSSADDTVQKALETLDELSSAGLPVVDTTAIVKDPTDATKLVRIDAGNVGTGQTRVITMPNQDVDLTPGQTFPGISSVILNTLATAAGQFIYSTASGTWVAKTVAEVKAILGLGSAAYTESTAYAAASHSHAEGDITGLTSDIAAKVPKSLYDANTILAATIDDTPAAVTVSEQTLVGRITGGAITALSVAQIKTLLGLGTAAYTASTDYATASHNHSGVYQAISSLLTSIAGLTLTGNGGKVISVKSDVSGFELTTPSSGSLDIHGLTGESGIVSGDEIPFYDGSAVGNRKITIQQLQMALGNITINYSPFVQITDFTATPASTSTITTTSDLTGSIYAGYPIKYTISSTTYYGIVTAITSNLITVAGPSLGGDITALYYGNPDRVIQLDFLIPGYYEDATNFTLFAADLGQCIPWRQAPAYVAYASVRSRIVDGSSNGTWNLVKSQGHAGIAQAGASTTITLSARASATDDYYNNMYVAIVAGTGSGQIRQITDYVGSTKVATVPTWTTTPNSTSEYKILLGDPSGSGGLLTSPQTIAYAKEWYGSGILINSSMYQLAWGSEIELYAGKGTGGDAQDLSGVIVLVMR